MNPRETLIQKISSLSNEYSEDIFKEEKDDRCTIIQDLNRTPFHYSIHKNNPNILKVYKYLLFDILTKSTIPYVQGFAEIAGVILNAFLEDKMARLVLKNEKFPVKTKNMRTMSDKSVENLQKLRDNANKLEAKYDNIIDSDSTNATETNTDCLEINFEENFEFIDPHNYSIVQEFIRSEQESLNILRKGIPVFLYKKVFPLTIDNMKLYYEYNNILFVMLQNDNVILKDGFKYLSYKYIGTLFLRNLNDVNDIYTIFNIVIDGDIITLFAIFYVLYKNLNVFSEFNHEVKLNTLPNHFLDSVKASENKFKETTRSIQLSKKKNFLFTGVASIAVMIGAAIIYKNINKKEK